MQVIGVATEDSKKGHHAVKQGQAWMGSGSKVCWGDSSQQVLTEAKIKHDKMRHGNALKLLLTTDVSIRFQSRFVEDFCPLEKNDDVAWRHHLCT